MNTSQFAKWHLQSVLLPDGERVVCYYFRNGGSNVSLYDENHNVFRLNKDNNVIWQVRRDEQGKRDWNEMHAIFIAQGQEGYRDPFVNLLVVQPDGTRKRNPASGRPLDEDHWVPGCKVYCNGDSGFNFELDVETGVARNITEGRIRPW